MKSTGRGLLLLKGPDFDTHHAYKAQVWLCRGKAQTPAHPLSSSGSGEAEHRAPASPVGIF